MQNEEKGKFVYGQRSKDGVGYSMYVPANVNEDTQVFIYMNGKGGEVDNIKVASQYVRQNNANSIVIMPPVTNYSGDWGTRYVNIVEEVKAQYGITHSNVSAGGFSKGGHAGYVTVAENIRRNPDCEPQIAYFIDDYADYTYYKHDTAATDPEVTQLFKDTDSVLFIVEGRFKHPEATKAYGESGMNVIRVACYYDEHNVINKNFFKDGFYDYMAGGVLPSEHYTYQRYNQETGQWEDIPYEEICTKEKLFEYLNIDGGGAPNLDTLYGLKDIIIKSDDKTLENHINAIRGAIRNSSFLKANYSSANFYSTTQIPNAIPEVLTNYFQSTAQILNSIARKTVSIAKIAGEIDYQDKQIADRATVLNSAEPLYKTAEAPMEEMLQEVTDENLLESSTQPENLITDATQNLGTTQNTGPTNLNSQNPFTNQNSSIPSQNTYPSTNNSSQNNNYPSQTPNYSDVGYTGGGSGGGTSNSYPPSQPQTSPQTTPPTTPQTIPPTEPSTEATTQPETTPSTEVVTEVPTEVITSPEEIPIEENFPEYEEIYSDEDQLVYNYNDEYKVVVHHDGENINAIEHYYDFETPEAATAAVEQLQAEYENAENFDQIIQNDRYVKVLFKEEMYNDLNLEQIKEQYQDLDEVIQNIDSTENIERLPETESSEITEYEEDLEEI